MLTTSRRCVSDRTGRSRPACTVGSTVHPRPSVTISRSTSGWWDSATTWNGAPIERSAARSPARVCESRRERHPRDPSSRCGSDRAGPGARTRRGPRSAAPTIHAVDRAPAARRTPPGRARTGRATASSEPDGATSSLSSTSGRSRRYRRSTLGKWCTAAASIMPSRNSPLGPPRCLAAHAPRSMRARPRPCGRGRAPASPPGRASAAGPPARTG